ncbi:hypothetical protein BJ878DRAFT_477157 [Calycina marina]|uniref:MIT domain-containing protein n=1 Tax=Calycina marina TaxID=1763456 RepID=A0A9P7ZA01_9HELO|nr:hypothetical protein BJ878DRAFT_477157 [Calycina marina]
MNGIAPEPTQRYNSAQPSYASATSGSNNYNKSSGSSAPSLQRSASFVSRSRSRGQTTPQHPSSNGLENYASLPHLTTPPEVRRDHSVERLGNYNRWSRSTSSSRETNSAPKPGSRRMSLGAPVSFNFGSPEQERTSSGRLQKSRPSTGNRPSTGSSLARQEPATRVFESSVSPIPPILNLPSLQIPSPNTGSSPLTDSPSTAGLLSAAVRSAVPDYYSSWDSTPRDFSRAKSPTRTRSDTPNSALTTAGGINGERANQEGIKRSESTSRGHSRDRSEKSSGSFIASKQPSQKAMLSKALQKANTAVLLDNAQNFEGATQAYSEACVLLQHVMQRNSGDDDRRKLEAIRYTYTSRINELKKISPTRDSNGKALPARPESGVYSTSEPQFVDEDENPAIIETATVTRIVNDQSYTPDRYPQTRAIPESQVPRCRESLKPASMDSGQYGRGRFQEQLDTRSCSRSPMRESHIASHLHPPMDNLYMPPPLSPRRPLSPLTFEPTTNNTSKQQLPYHLASRAAEPSVTVPTTNKGHARVPSNESMSWLDTIDESGGSSGASSVHSRTSSMRLRRKHIRGTSGGTEAEFDAALDAAVEAAYDEGFEPEHPRDNYDYEDDDEIVANVRRRVELAKERVRQSERETLIQEALDSERKRRIAEQNSAPQKFFDDMYEGNDSEEEERMLEEMTSGYVLDDFEFGLQSKSALPRESDSSGFSGRTWHSSIGSNPTTVGTTLSTVTETWGVPQIPPLLSKIQAPLHPPPAQALPPPPPPNVAGQPPVSISQSVRNRRLSGQNAMQLKIETSTSTEGEVLAQPLGPPISMPLPRLPSGNDATQPKTTGLPRLHQALQEMENLPPMPISARQASSPFPGPTSPIEMVSAPTPVLSKPFTNEFESNSQIPRSGSPGRAPSRSGLRTNFSSSSLQKMKSRNLSISNLDDGDSSPVTPESSQFASREANQALPAMPTLPTPIAMTFKEKMNGVPTGGLYLFNSDITSPNTPGSPSLMGDGAPISLEPCPTEFLLRPFWLMRALYQTMAHPRGGYLSTKLFVPRDVWKVKGVKIKNLDDKITNCDYLTAALQKLAKVDTFDADAVLEEMQVLEGVLDQVQSALTKKLGSEVGSQSSGVMFKETSGEPEQGNISKSGSMSSKSSSFSWRRLRTKNSGASLANNYSNKTPSTEAFKEGLVTGTVPMTSTAVSKVRFAKRDVSQVDFSGPNANYMGALARLFDATQTLDQIARQVEDPGLRHADKTQVGLELCTRHAAEFFGFYICRFVLTDVGMLLDKFIKRGSEWVLV